MIAFRAGDLAVLLYGFAKSERDDIEPDELRTLRLIAAQWLGDPAKIEKDVTAGILIEVRLKTTASALPSDGGDDRVRGRHVRQRHHGRGDVREITMRQFAGVELAIFVPLSAADIRAIREQSRMSQAVFAKHLNLTVGYVSQLERGAKRPTGATLALLTIIQRKGIQAVI